MMMVQSLQVSLLPNHALAGAKVRAVFLVPSLKKGFGPSVWGSFP